MICFLATREPCSLPYSRYKDSKSECKTSNLSIGEGSFHLSPSKAARIEEKIQGFPCAALPIIKPSAFVFDKALNAELPHLISPLTNTGIPTESLIAAIVSYSAGTSYLQFLVLPCIAIAEIPSDSAILAIVTPFLFIWLGPVLILRVTGLSEALTTALNIFITSVGSLSNAEPAAFLQTFLAGHPILISTISAPLSQALAAPSAINTSSPPTSCTILGLKPPSDNRV